MSYNTQQEIIQQDNRAEREQHQLIKERFSQLTKFLAANNVIIPDEEMKKLQRDITRMNKKASHDDAQTVLTEVELIKQTGFEILKINLQEVNQTLDITLKMLEKNLQELEARFANEASDYKDSLKTTIVLLSSDVEPASKIIAIKLLLTQKENRSELVKEINTNLLKLQAAYEKFNQANKYLKANPVEAKRMRDALIRDAMSRSL